MKKILATLVVAFLLVGCSPKKTIIAACSQSDGVYSVEVTLESTNGKTITTFTQNSELNLAAAGIDEAQFEELAAELSPSFEGKGVTYSYSAKDGLGIEQFIVNMKDVEVDMLRKTGIIDSSTNTTILDLDMTLENYENLGLNCTKTEK